MNLVPPVTALANVRGLFGHWMDIGVIAGFFFIFFLLLILLVLRISGRRSSYRNTFSLQDLERLQDKEAPERPPPLDIDRPTPPPGTLRTQPRHGSSDTQPLRVSATRPYNAPEVPTAAQVEELEKEDPAGAAALWGRLGRWERAAAVHKAQGNLLTTARIWLGLRNPERALPLLKQAFSKSPVDEKLRLLLIETLIDLGDIKEARELITPVCEPDAPVPPSAHFLFSLGRAFESLGELEEALSFYQMAFRTDDSTSELQQRLLFLRHVMRLSPISDEEDSNAPSPAKEFLDRAIGDSTIAALPQNLGQEASSEVLRGHEVIVGHLAFGFRTLEPRTPVHSRFSPARRYLIERLISENDTSAVFEARDQLLDFPVALKLYHLPAETKNCEILKERLRRIALLNHPNLAKLTFADRDGSMIRLATEYLSGGNLGDFLTKLGGAGLPLIIRMSMHLASALHTSHLRGICHGDIRPENILIGPDQRIKLIDFSLSPIPIYNFIDPNRRPDESTETPRILKAMGKTEGVQSDLIQFGEVLDFMLNHARRTVDPIASGAPDPTEELRDLVKRLQTGQFNSVLRLWQVLDQIFQQTLPGSNPNNPKSKDL